MVVKKISIEYKPGFVYYNKPPVW